MSYRRYDCEDCGGYRDVYMSVSPSGSDRYCSGCLGDVDPERWVSLFRPEDLANAYESGYIAGVNDALSTLEEREQEDAD